MSYTVRRRTLSTLREELRPIQEDSLTLPNKVELVSGITTAVLAIFNPLVLDLPYRDFVAFILISIVVAAASYIHVIHRNIVAFVILLIAGGIISFIGVVGAAIVVSVAFTSWSVLLIYVPGWTAFIAVIACMVTQLRRRKGNTDERK